MTGFADLTMAGTAWTLSGAMSTTGTAANTIDVQTGTLTLSGVVTTGNNGGATIAHGAGLAIGAGGTSGSFTGNIVDNGVLTLQRSDNIDLPQHRQRHRLAREARRGHGDVDRREQLFRRHAHRGRRARACRATPVLVMRREG